MDNYAIRCWD